MEEDVRDDQMIRMVALVTATFFVAHKDDYDDTHILGVAEKHEKYIRTGEIDRSSV